MKVAATFAAKLAKSCPGSAFTVVASPPQDGVQLIGCGLFAARYVVGRLAVRGRCVQVTFIILIPILNP